MTGKNKKRKTNGSAESGRRGRADQSGSPPLVSIIIPCYNEEEVVEETLSKVRDFLDGLGPGYEVIVVDDGSKDSTVDVVKRAQARWPQLRLLINDVNRGKGFSVRRGALSAKGSCVCFSDADLSTPINEFSKLRAELGLGFDVAIGSRSIKGSEVLVHQPWWRELMGKTFNLFVQALAIRGIKDTQCGFKCFKAEAAKRIFERQTLDGFSFDVEALFIARQLGYRIKEVPVKWINRVESKVNPIVHPLQMLRDLVRIRIRAVLGRYA